MSTSIVFTKLEKLGKLRGTNLVPTLIKYYNSFFRKDYVHKILAAEFLTKYVLSRLNQPADVIIVKSNN